MRWSKLPDEEKLKWINRSLEQQTQYEEVGVLLIVFMA
jgi:hypothetical protein